MKRLSKIGIAAVLTFATSSVLAVYEELDGIVAVVDDDVVLASELKMRYDQVISQMAQSKIQRPPDNILISQLMERLIIESIQEQEARKRGIEIDDETLSRAVDSFARSNNMTIEQFQRALASDGMSYVQFREEIRSEMMVQRLQRNLINRRISISEQDVKGLLNSPYYSQLFSDEYRVGHILLSLENTSSEAAMEAALGDAAAIVEELRGGADFAQMAVARSSSSRALEGGDLGWRRAGTLPSLFSETVLTMQVGEIAEPIRTADAVHVIKLLERRGAGMEQVAQTNLRHILVQPSEIRTPAETAELIREIKARIDVGEDFAELAAEFSQDPSSAQVGGDLGWSTPDAFVPEFAAAMDATEIGATSEPFLSQYGWHVLQVIDRRQEDMSDEARERMALDILHKQRFEEEQQEWLKEIRDEAFVEVRL